MKNFEGYLKKKFGDNYVLLAGGSHKSLSDFAMANAYLPLSGGTMTGPIYFGLPSTNTTILAYNSDYPKFGIWYNEGEYDTMKLSASGNADTDAGADLCINGNGDGTVTIRGKSILHSGGGTLSGIITRDAGGEWIKARDNVIIKTTRTSGEGSDWHPAVGIKTSAGFWSFGSVGGEHLGFSYDTDADYNSNSNNNIRVDIPKKAGTIALTSDITWANVLDKPSTFTPASHNHDSVYAKLAAHNNLTASGNEFTFASSGFSGGIYLNYRTAGGLNGNITEYILGNGKGGVLGTIIHSGNLSSYAIDLTSTQSISGAKTFSNIRVNNLPQDTNMPYFLGINAFADGGIVKWVGYADAKVGYASSAGNSDTCDGLHVHSGRNDNANKIVRTDGSGYMQCGWINTTSGGFNGPNSGINKVYCSEDNYIRYLSKSDFISAMGLFTTSGGTISAGGYLRFADGSFQLSVSSGNRLSVGSNNQSVALGLNVGSLLVSNAWADYTNVPTNGIWCKGNIYASNFYTTSDIKKKKNIHKISKLLPIVEFDWKESEEHSYGFIAQELESLGYLELVSGKEEKTVNYNAALSLCVAQLSNIVEDNKLKIKELEAKIVSIIGKEGI